MKNETNRPSCPECGHKMHKDGFTWSGRTKAQKWKCPACGRVTMRKDGSG